MSSITYSTVEAAEKLRVSTAALYRSMWADGNYFGAKPLKMPNGRLRWSKPEIDRLAEGVER